MTASGYHLTPARETLLEPSARDVVKRNANRTVMACASVNVLRKNTAQISFASIFQLFEETECRHTIC
jgi:hypothetical protein